MLQKMIKKQNTNLKILRNKQKLIKKYPKNPLLLKVFLGMRQSLNSFAALFFKIFKKFIVNTQNIPVGLPNPHYWPLLKYPKKKEKIWKSLYSPYYPYIYIPRDINLYPNFPTCRWTINAFFCCHFVYISRPILYAILLRHQKLYL